MAIGLTLSGVRTISFSLLFFFNHSSTFLLAINIVSISSIISHLGNEPFWRFIRHELVRQLLLVLIVISEALGRMALLLSLLILLIIRLLLSHLGWFSGDSWYGGRSVRVTTCKQSCIIVIIIFFAARTIVIPWSLRTWLDEA